MNGRSYGNDAVVAALEKLLARAREGRMGYLAAISLEEGQPPLSFIGGSIALLPSACEAVDGVAGRMRAGLLNRTLPPRDPALGRDYVCYNMATAPLSFDFLTWLVDAEMTRVRAGAPAPLKVAFWFGRDGNTELTPPRRQFFENVMRPAVALLGAVETDNTGGRFKDFFNFRDVLAMARAGVPVPRIKAPRYSRSRLAQNYVTITLREAAHWPKRNSDLDVWLSFADYLDDQNQVVIFIRDAGKALEELPGGRLQWRDASFNLAERASVYDGAALNFFVANGPFSLALFMDRPWIAFTEAPRDDDPYYPNQPAFWRDMAGMEPGTQYPWATAYQRMIWQKPTFDLLVEAWEYIQVRCGKNERATVSAP